jgi:enediyne polyketide synthase
MRDGITPIPTEKGIDLLRQLLADPAAPPAMVICGRTGGLATITIEQRELPLARFVDRALVHYPEIELITEADLSEGSDPYLGDHLLDGDLLFPAVMGMEAMTQVASAVAGTAGAPVLENVEFLRPIIVGRGSSTTVRLAALVREAGTVDVVLRSEETGFSADHFRARLRFPCTTPECDPVVDDRALPSVVVDPVTELYGGVLFQGKRFQRLAGYYRASARHALAEIATKANHTWFAPFLPQIMHLADPGVRDTMMHALQCCVPDATLLPQGVERLYLADPQRQEAEYLVLDGRERSQDGDSFTYDLDVRDPSGVLVERWEGLTLRAVRKRGGSGTWVPAMLGSYLERSLERVLGGTRAVVVEPDPAGSDPGDTAGRRAQTKLAVSRALHRPTELRYRPDGKPECDDVEVSASHGGGVTLAVAGTGVLTCDVEAAAERTEDDWAGLLGGELLGLRDLLAAESGESVAVASTRVWSALECIRKAGSMTQALTASRVHDDGWVLLSAGEARIATRAMTINGRPDPVVFAVLVGEEN